MSDLPPGVERRVFNGSESIATAGEPVYGEPVVDGWRRWSTDRSKVGGLIDRGVDIGITKESRVLYLGAASGTTVSHISDIVDVVYAVEFGPRPMRDLNAVAATRKRIIPLLKDARQPETYAHVVESNIDILIQDVATRDQAQVALANKQFLHPEGTLVLTIKARSEDVSRKPKAVFSDVISRLETGYRIDQRIPLDPVHVDHLAVIGHPRK